MIKIIARRKVKPECVEAYLELAAEMGEKSRAEDGCLGYTLNQSMEDEYLYTVIEFWKDQAAIDAHNASEHFQRIVPQYAALTAEKFAVEHYQEV